MKQPNKVCDWCKKPFYMPPCFARVHYCSKECYWAAKKGWKLTAEWKQKIREGVKQNLPSTAFKKGQHQSPGTEFKNGEHLEEKHPQWKCGEKVYVKIFARNHREFKCELCGEDKKRILIHHKDKNRKNNNIQNLMAVCDKCHGIIHRKHEYGKKCLWCGNQFESYRKEQRFCSISCGLKNTHARRKNANKTK